MENKQKKILIIGAGEGKTALTHQMMKEKYGDDIVLVTPEEAKEQGLLPEDFANTPRFNTPSPPVFETHKLYGFEKTGREKRRERRKKERKLKRGGK